jgi:hypothetical protein
VDIDLSNYTKVYAIKNEVFCSVTAFTYYTVSRSDYRVSTDRLISEKGIWNGRRGHSLILGTILAFAWRG